MAHSGAMNDSAFAVGLLLGGFFMLATPIGAVILVRKTLKHLKTREARTPLSWRLAAAHLALGGLLLLLALVFSHSYIVFIWLSGGVLMLGLAAALIRQPRGRAADASFSSPADDSAE